MSKELAKLQERLLHLFLRLCGYFPIGFVLHAADGQGTLNGEIDTLAIRLRWHSEPETGNRPPAWLNAPSDKTDLVVCEAKTSKGFFNKSLKNVDNLVKVVRRFGIVDEAAALKLAGQANSSLANNSSPTIDIPEASAQIRFLLFHGEGHRSSHRNAESVIFADEVIAHCWSCFTPNEQPPTCQRRYPLDHWWPNDDIVELLKNSPTCPNSLRDLASRLEPSGYSPS